MTPRSSCPGGESTPLQGANLRLNYEINNVTDTALGNLARGKPSFCRSDRCLSYRPPGSLLESRGGSILARAEGPSRSAISGSRRPRVDCASTSRIVSARFTAGGSCFESLQCAPVIRNNSTAYTHCAGPQNCRTPTIRSRSSFWTLRHLAQRWSASRRRSSIPRAGLPSGRRQPRGFPAGADRSLEVEPGPELDGSVAGGVAGNIPEVRAGYVGDRIGHSLAIECVQEIRAYGGDVLLFEA